MVKQSENSFISMHMGRKDISIPLPTPFQGKYLSRVIKDIFAKLRGWSIFYDIQVVSFNVLNNNFLNY